MVEFGGWDMPVEYTGITEEHLAVRTRAGLFDVSHMGQIELAGPDALAVVQWLTSNDASRLSIGQIQYSALTTPAGTFVDDVLVYRMAADHYLLVVNAGNIMKDHEWIVTQARARGGDCSVVNSSSRYALIAVQGPEAEAILQTLTAIDLAGHQVLLVRHRRSRQRSGDRLPHRLHGRGRVRDLRAAGAGRAGVGRLAAGRRVGRHQTLRPGRARHPASRGLHAPLRQRHG